MPRARRLFREFGTGSEFIAAGWRVEMRVWALFGVALALTLVLAAACSGGERAGVREGAALPPARLADAAELSDGSVPRMLNIEPPFRYPAELYARKVQGNVTLRLHVDSAGRVRPESTSVVTSSGFPALDSAAIQGAVALRFAPAVREGRPVGRSIRFPVFFRHPAAPPLPGDSVLKP